MNLNMKIKKILGIGILGVALTLTGCSTDSQKKENKITLGMTAIEENAYDTAIEYFNHSIEAGEELQLAYRGLGMTYLKQGEYNGAKEAFICALQNGSFGVSELEVDISCYLAATYCKLEDYENALETYDNLLELEKKNGDIYYLRGVVRLDSGNLEGAISDFDVSIKLEDKNIQRYINIYKELENVGEKDRGRGYLEQACTLLTEKDNYEKGRISYYLEDYNGAISQLEPLVQSGDNKATLYLGKSYEALGDMNYAASLYEKYIQTDENNGEVYNQLGLCKLNMGEYEVALDYFKKGIETKDSEVMQELLFNEATAYEYIADFSTAKTKFSEYLKKYPEDENAQREYEFLKSR